MQKIQRCVSIWQREPICWVLYVCREMLSGQMLAQMLYQTLYFSKSVIRQLLTYLHGCRQMKMQTDFWSTDIFSSIRKWYLANNHLVAHNTESWNTRCYQFQTQNWARSFMKLFQRYMVNISLLLYMKKIRVTARQILSLQIHSLKTTHIRWLMAECISEKTQL